tara:strand:- start:202 stop:1302 length:1101 start_codon:yes stop_codon:yes gene_type:complete
MNNTNLEDRCTVTLAEAPALIAAAHRNKFYLGGEPGVGKTSIVAELSRITGYPYAIIDVPNMGIGDAAIPIPDTETETLKYYPNARFGLQNGVPVIICLDEFTKGSDEAKNTLHPLLEVKDPRLGDSPLPKGSIVLMTGNLESDGVGDSLKAHSKMRITQIEISKPDHEEWLLWAAENDIEPIVMAWVNRTPDCLASYMDKGQHNNPYIFNPSIVGQGSVVTPRTLELASNLVRTRHLFTNNALRVALAGTIGAAATNSMMHFIQHHESMTPWSEIKANPNTAPIPPNVGACAVLTFSAVEHIKTREDLDAFMTYISRKDAGYDTDEFQVIFGVSLAGPNSTNDKRRLAFTSRAFSVWADKNQDLL